MASALVFGASGQIGAALLPVLLRDGWQVTAVSRSPQPARAGLRWIQADLCRPAELPFEVDAVFSCGPLDHFSTWYADAASLRARVVAFGSTSVAVKQDSNDPHERALAARLAAAEARLFACARARGAAATVLRPTLVYGAGRDQTLTRIAQLARRTGFFVLPRSACGMRQPVHVQDLADAAHAALGCAGSHGRSYALPGGETLAYAHMVERTLASLQPQARLIQVPTALFKTALAGAHAVGVMRGLGQAALARMGEDLVFDAEPARRDFGYAPRSFKPVASMFSR
ncbi:MAG: NAD-dependent epimerase/dehydratase family protein [Pseudoxanthomonas sp.]